MNDIYLWLLDNEQAFIDEISSDINSILKEARSFPDVDMSEYIDGVRDVIREYIEGQIFNNFNFNPEDFLMIKQESKIQDFIMQLQTTLIGGKDGNSHTLH